MGNDMKKRRKGIAIETIVYLVLAIVGLIVLWVFLSGLAPVIKTTVEEIVKGIGCKICEIFGVAGWVLSAFCRNCP